MANDLKIGLLTLYKHPSTWEENTPLGSFSFSFQFLFQADLIGPQLVHIHQHYFADNGSNLEQKDHFKI